MHFNDPILFTAAVNHPRPDVTDKPKHKQKEKPFNEYYRHLQIIVALAPPPPRFYYRQPPAQVSRALYK